MNIRVYTQVFGQDNDRAIERTTLGGAEGAATVEPGRPGHLRICRGGGLGRAAGSVSVRQDVGQPSGSGDSCSTRYIAMPSHLSAMRHQANPGYPDRDS